MSKHGRVLKSPDGRILVKKDWDDQLNTWHYLGNTCRGVIFSWGHNEGCCVFTNPRSRMIHRWFPSLRIIELARMVGKPHHLWSMTSLMSQALKEAKIRGFDICITYADPIAGHNGMVYRAGNWTSMGASSKERVWTLDGHRISRRTMYDRHGTQAEGKMKELYGSRLTINEGEPKLRFIIGVSKPGKKFCRGIGNNHDKIPYCST